MRKLLRFCIPMIDLILVPIAVTASLMMRAIRQISLGRLPLTLQAFRRVEFFRSSIIITNHYLIRSICESPCRKTESCRASIGTSMDNWNL